LGPIRSDNSFCATITLRGKPASVNEPVALVNRFLRDGKLAPKRLIESPTAKNGEVAIATP